MLGEIAAIRVGLVEAHRAILPFDAARTPSEAMFSVPHTVALALVRGAVIPADFTDAAIADPTTRALAAKVTVETRVARRSKVNVDPDDPDLVEITLTDGSTLATAVAVPRGAPANPLSPDEVLAKFALTIGSQGNIRTTTLRAFTEAEYRGIIQSLP